MPNAHRKIMDSALRRDRDIACAPLAERIKCTEQNVNLALRALAKKGRASALIGHVVIARRRSVVQM